MKIIFYDRLENDLKLLNVDIVKEHYNRVKNEYKNVNEFMRVHHIEEKNMKLLISV